MLILFRIDVSEQVLRDFVRYDPKRKDEGYVEGKIKSIATLDAWVATVLYS